MQTAENLSLGRLRACGSRTTAFDGRITLGASIFVEVILFEKSVPWRQCMPRR